MCQLPNGLSLSQALAPSDPHKAPERYLVIDEALAGWVGQVRTPRVKMAAWLSPSWPPLCPQGLALRIAERWKLTRARLHHRCTLLRGALCSWVVGASAGPSVTPCLGWDGGGVGILCPSLGLPAPPRGVP